MSRALHDAGVIIKYFTPNNTAIETDPNQNFIYYEQVNPKESRRLYAYARLLQNSGEQDLADVADYIDYFHNSYSVLMGEKKESTDVAHAPSFRGH